MGCSFYLEDGTTRIFLNIRGTNDSEVSPELVELLHYMEKTTDEAAKQCKSGRVKKLHERVHEVRASEEFGVKYMQAWEEKMYERLEGREEGDVYKRQVYYHYVYCVSSSSGWNGIYQYR